MRRLLTSVPVAVALCIHCAVALGQNCRGLEDYSAQGGVIAQLVNLIWKSPSEADCGSLNSVLGRLGNQGTPGGKRLEEKQPLDLAKAKANLQQAETDPDVHKRLEHIRMTISNPDQQLLYQAATLDEEGFYPARDLLIHQLRQKIK